MSEEYTKRALSIHRTLEKAPKLQQLFESGSVSMNQLARVVSVVTLDTQDFWLKQIKELSQSALETLVRDFRAKEAITNENNFENSLFDNNLCARTRSDHDFSSSSNAANSSESMSDNLPDNLDSARHGQPEDKTIASGSNQDDLAPAGEQPHIQPAVGLVPSSILKLKLSETVIEKLLKLQNKGFDLNRLLNELLDQRDQEIVNEKEAIAAELKQTDSRYIPKRITRLIEREHGKKCAVPHCRKKAAETHHANRFSISKTHDPYFLAPLCRGHHIMAHSVDRKFLEKRKFW